MAKDSPQSDTLVDIYDGLFFLWQKKIIFILFFFAGAITGGLYGIFGTPQYESHAVIAPITRSSSVDFSNVFSMGNTNVALLRTRLTSRSLSEAVADDDEILRHLFPKRWNSELQTWKDSLSPKVTSAGGYLRSQILQVEANEQRGTIDIRVRVPDSTFSKVIADRYLSSLRSSIQEGMRKDLQENKEFLEEQLAQTTDPLIATKIKDLVARNLEKSLINNPSDFQVIEYPAYPTGKSAPQMRKSIVLLGVLFGAASIIGLFSFWLLRSFAHAYTEYAKTKLK